MDSDLGGENYTKIDANFGNVDTKKDIREECRCPHRLEIYTKTKSEVSCQYLCRDWDALRMSIACILTFQFVGVLHQKPLIGCISV